ncbi:MAG: FMN-binding protein [Rhodocyclaceae bacterium]|nr:FMN-binding protein [Rhodocyclaceae bacterium]MDZ4215521.1 FMN-binding protein [Rhodocyclaceae bacterium]
MNVSVPLPQTTPPLVMIRALGLIAAICGLIIVSAYQGTYDAVQENKRIAVERAVFKVIPTAKSIVEYWALPDGQIEKVGAGGAAQQGAIKFYAGYDERDALAGIAAEGAAKGYADSVRILFAYDPGQQAITGFGVVSSRETPGIGDKIVTDKAFLANFPLDAKVSNDSLANEIRAVKNGSKTSPWQVDAIAGATITSRAVAKAINDTAQALVPRLATHLDKLKDKP